MPVSITHALLLSLCLSSVASASFVPQRRAPKAGSPAPQAVTSRQLTKAQLLSRHERRKSFAAHDPTYRLRPRQSAEPAVTCDSIDVGLGYAVFYGSNAPINNAAPIARPPDGPSTAAECAAYCDDFGPECIGFAFAPGDPGCSIKVNAAGTAEGIEPSTVWDMYLEGSCSEYASLTGVTCCNSAPIPPAPETTCAAEGVPAGRVRYYAQNLNGNNLGQTVTDVSVTECDQICVETEGCSGYAYNPSSSTGVRLCALKSGSASEIASLLGPNSVWTTTILADSCNALAGSTNAACCVTPSEDTFPADGITDGSIRYAGQNVNTENLNPSVVGLTIAECDQYCSDNEGCTAYAYGTSSAGQPLCQLKTGSVGDLIDIMVPNSVWSMTYRADSCLTYFDQTSASCCVAPSVTVF